MTLACLSKSKKHGSFLTSHFLTIYLILVSSYLLVGQKKVVTLSEPCGFSDSCFCHLKLSISLLSVVYREVSACIFFPLQSYFSLLSQHETGLLRLPLLPICHVWEAEQRNIVCCLRTRRASRTEKLQPLEETLQCLRSRHYIPPGFSKDPWLFYPFFFLSSMDQSLNCP